MIVRESIALQYRANWRTIPKRFAHQRRWAWYHFHSWLNRMFTVAKHRMPIWFAFVSRSMIRT